LWNPTYGELRLETNAAILSRVITGIWDAAKFAPEAATGQQPVVSFVGTVPVFIKQVNKTFRAPVIKIVGYIPRDQVPGWADRPPTVLPPKAMSVLPAASAAPPPSTPTAAKSIKKAAKAKVKQAATKPDPDDPIEDVLGGDDIPWK
jgi:hypothetical protein